MARGKSVSKKSVKRKPASKKSVKRKPASKKSAKRKPASRKMKGGLNKVYLLIDVDNESNIMEVHGDTTLKFNDRTEETFKETYRHVKQNKSASKCFYIPVTNMWYQLVYNEGKLYQISYDGTRKRRIELKHIPSELTDDQIAELIKVPVHSGTTMNEKWEKRLLSAFKDGKVTVYDIIRVIKSNRYLGGRWLIGHLINFVEKHKKNNKNYEDFDNFLTMAK